MLIWRIAVPVPLRRVFDYLPPQAGLAFDDDVANNSDGRAPARGARVLIPFGSRELVGFFLETATTTELAPEKLQAVRAVLEREPVFSTSVLRLCEFAAQYYQHPLGEVLQQALPTALRVSDTPKTETIQQFVLSDTGRLADLETFKRSPRQRALLQLMQTRAAPILKAELQSEGFSTPQWQALLARELIRVESIQPERYAQDLGVLKPLQVTLNAEQTLAVQAVLKTTKQFACHLLLGITGSGKTEVYLEAIAAIVSQGQQALVLVPEIGLTPQTERRFRERFGDRVAVLHSGLTDKQRWRNWLAAKTGEVSVIIGTRSALFVPLKNPGLLIVDEEHDLSFKQQEGFRYHARDLAVRRAQLEQIPLLLGSATPALESLRNAELGRYQLLELRMRAGLAQLPGMRCIDLRQQRLHEGLAPELIALMHKHLAAGGQVLLFLNRRGFAPTLLCHACGWVAACAACAAHFTWHKSAGRLRCHHCASEQRVPSQCPSCKAGQFVALGQGTERIEQALQTLFPAHAIARIDRDSARGREGMSRFQDGIRSGKYRILLGTQMLAKGHDFPGVTLSALLDIDAGLFAADFRAPERMAQLITQVAGRAGRGTSKGEVVLQTHQPEHPLLQTLLAGGYRAFAATALPERSQHGLPPFQYHALLRAEAKTLEAALALLTCFKQALAGAITGAGEVLVLGPIPAPQPLRAGRYRAQLLLEAAARPALAKVLTPVLTAAEQWPQARAARWSIDIDPMEMS